MLTTGVDAGADFTGTDEDDVFNAPLASTPDGSALVQTLQTGDVLDGGEGFNILNAQIADGDPLFGVDIAAAPTISNIQQYNLRSFNNGAELDLEFATGYEQLWNRDSRFDLELMNVGEVAAIGMENVRDSRTYSVGYDDIEVETQVVFADRVGRMNQLDVELDIYGVDGNIGTLDLNVSNGVYLELWRDAADTENLIISGEGALRLSGEDEFQNLVTLDATGYNEDLVLDVSGGGNLEEVLTGDGDDRITVNNAAVNGDLSVDLGEGDNVLAIRGVDDDADVNALDFTGGVSGVQTLELLDEITLGNDATLDLTGFDVSPANIAFVDGIVGGEDLEIINAAADLNITGASVDIDALSGEFENLMVTTAGYLQFRINGGVDNLETLAATSTVGNAELYLNDGPALVSVDLTAFDGANLYIDTDLSGDDTENLDALETINVTAQTSDANLEIEGNTDGSMLTSLTTVNVMGQADANVDIEDVWGEFALNVEAVLDDADVELTNVGVTSVIISAGNDVDLSIENAPNLVTIDVTAGNDADVELVADGDDFDALTTVNITADRDAGLTMNGTTGIAAAQQVQEFVVSGAPTASGNITLGVPGVGNITVAVLDTDSVNDVAEKIADALEGLAAYTAEDDPAGTAVATRVDDGPVGPITVDAGTTGVTFSSTAVTTPGVIGVPAEGFGGLETITVDAGDDAGVRLEDVVGSFELSVTAGDDADVFLQNTGMTAATVTAGSNAYVDLWEGNADVETIVVTADTTNIFLQQELTSLTTLDVSAVETNVFITAATGANGGALFGGPVEYLIGATDDVSIIAETTGQREVFSFVGDDIGNVEIANFDDNAVAAIRDALDFSAFANITGAANLAFTDVGGDLVIEAADGQFEGSITLLGLAGEEAFISQFSIIYT